MWWACSGCPAATTGSPRSWPRRPSCGCAGTGSGSGRWRRRPLGPPASPSTWRRRSTVAGRPSGGLASGSNPIRDRSKRPTTRCRPPWRYGSRSKASSAFRVDRLPDDLRSRNLATTYLGAWSTWTVHLGPGGARTEPDGGARGVEIARGPDARPSGGHGNGDGDPVPGSSAVLTAASGGPAVTFSYLTGDDPCSQWALVGTGPSADELTRVAENLAPTVFELHPTCDTSAPFTASHLPVGFAADAVAGTSTDFDTRTTRPSPPPLPRATGWRSSSSTSRPPPAGRCRRARSPWPTGRTPPRVVAERHPGRLRHRPRFRHRHPRSPGRCVAVPARRVEAVGPPPPHASPVTPPLGEDPRLPRNGCPLRSKTPPSPATSTYPSPVAAMARIGALSASVAAEPR